MKYLHQIMIILLFSCLGEGLHLLIPAPVPASIYGMVLLFASLALKLIKLSSCKETGSFLISILPLLFVAPIVSLMDCWDAVSPNLAAIAVILIVSTVLCFLIAGWVTQLFIKKRKGEN